ncbi:DUF1330 domain-containing protein [Streptomyces roseifaciens]
MWFGALITPHVLTPSSHQGVSEVLDGNWPGSMVLIEFPGLTEARAWYDSPAYQDILRLRTDHIEGDVLVIDGVGPGYDPAERARVLRAEAERVWRHRGVASCACASLTSCSSSCADRTASAVAHGGMCSTGPMPWKAWGRRRCRAVQPGARGGHPVREVVQARPVAHPGARLLPRRVRAGARGAQRGAPGTGRPAATARLASQ